ncbi:hypothetical protein BMJ32_17580 [Sinorhizobium medicae]|nr:hypothetical protein BMJ32_17580 [Sinorhizobium medicae]PLU51909.1 hypothetical protein BMJ23_25440 [Sinorhizobium medicae]PLU61959.1 hypothetical protein BMJ21_30500 [Sinorhizobium medicae]PLU63505.1 hypothetical protein BMJ22_29235 [Sinorhizobium medicae]
MERFKLKRQLYVVLFQPLRQLHRFSLSKSGVSQQLWEKSARLLPNLLRLRRDSDQKFLAFRSKATTSVLVDRRTVKLWLLPFQTNSNDDPAM